MPELAQRGRIHRDAIFAIVLGLMAIGLVMVASAKAPLDKSLIDLLVWRAPFGRQVIFVAAGIIILFVASRLAVPILARDALVRRIVLIGFAVAIVGLVAALLPGIANPQRGSHRWLQVTAGGHTINLQPSEFAKLALVTFLAWLLTRPDVDLKRFWRGFLPAAAAIGVCVALVGKADFGTAVLFAVVGGLMLLVAGCRWSHLIATGVIGAVGLAALLYVEPYRRARITAFLTPTDDPLGAGYQPLQSLTTIASGGWTGVGLGAGIQKHGYLPESHTDFIFAVICEEAGLFGAALVIALFGAFVWLGAKAMWSAATPFDRLTAFGITSVIGWQAVMNIAVVTVVAPTTGISLPFISAGGSGLLTMCAATGVLAAIARRGVKPATNARGLAVEEAGAIRYGSSPRGADVC